MRGTQSFLRVIAAGSSPRRSRCLVLACFTVNLAHGCADSPVRVGLPVEIEKGATLLLGRVVDGAVVGAWVWTDAENHRRIDLPSNEVEGSSLELFVYAPGTGLIAAEEGVLAPRPREQGGLLPLAPDLSYALSPILDEAVFRPIEAAKATLASFSYARPVQTSPCHPFEAASVPIDYLFERPRLVELDARRVLVLAGLEVAIYELGVGLRAIDVTPRACLLDGFRSQAGDVYVSACGRELYRARLSEGADRLELQRVASTPASVAHFDWLDGGQGPRGFELIGISDSGSAAFFDGLEWTNESSLEPRDIDVTSLGGAVWLGPGRGLVGLASEAQPLSIVDGVAERVPTDSMSGVASMFHSPTLGPVVGDSTAAFWIMSGGRFRALGPSPIGSWATVIVGVSGGFLFGMPFGAVGKYTTEAGMCRPEPAVAFEVIDLAVLGEEEALLVAGSLTTDQNVKLALVQL